MKRNGSRKQDLFKMMKIKMLDILTLEEINMLTKGLYKKIKTEDVYNLFKKVNNATTQNELYSIFNHNPK